MASFGVLASATLGRKLILPKHSMSLDLLEVLTPVLVLNSL